jgi:dTDP-glucose pyrophosphorylase/predicted transcriptional regulator
MISDQKIIKTISLNLKDKVLEAIKIMTKIGLQIVIVTNDKNQFKGIINDYDLRQAFLNGYNLDANLSLIYNKSPFFLKRAVDEITGNKILKEQNIEHIPIVNNKKLIGVFTSKKFYNPKKKSKKILDAPVIIMTGGYGKRLGSITSNYPKGMLCLNNKPLLQIILENAKNFSFYNFKFSVFYKKNIIKKYFQDGKKFNVKIDYIEEKRPMGTIGSLGLLKNEKSKNLIVLNCDVITKADLSKMLNFHKNKNSFATIGIKNFSYKNPYGVVKNNSDKFISFEEKPIIDFNINAGIYIFNSKVIKIIKNNKIKDINELILYLKKIKRKISLFSIYEEWVDYGAINKKLGKLKNG